MIKPSLLLSFLVSFSTRQLGALVINLSPSRLKGLFPGKTGPTKAMHMAFEVARDVSMAPVVIYIDECDQVTLDYLVPFQERAPAVKNKKSESAEAQRFRQKKK